SPIAFTWNGSEIVLCTTKNAPKLPHLRENPAVALTIDTEVHPPKILLIRGRAELDVVDGIPQEYLQMNGSYEMTPEQRVEWEAEVGSLYDGMARVGPGHPPSNPPAPPRSSNWSGCGPSASPPEPSNAATSTRRRLSAYRWI